MMPRWLLAVALAVVALPAAAKYHEATAVSALFYCKAAYCVGKSSVASWGCGPSCQFHPGFAVKAVYANASLQSAGYSGYDAASGAIVLAFRGTDNLRNWMTDLNFIKTHYALQPRCACEVHAGFLHEWESMRAGALADVRALHAAHAAAPVFVTGHSLGAAVSVLAAVDIATELAGARAVKVYNFGEPRVGGKPFAAYAAAVLGEQYRVTHERDPVPHLPPMRFGFLHAPHEVWYDNDGDTGYKVCHDSAEQEDPDCSDSELDYVVDDHLHYLGHPTGCNGP
jgi:hypothetical protein